MIIALGDIHSNFEHLEKAIIKSNNNNYSAIIQVGDFGLFDDNKNDFHEICKLSNSPIYFIDGELDDYDKLKNHKQVTKIWDDAKLFYVPRGTVIKIEHKTIAFIGGTSNKNTIKNGSYIKQSDVCNVLQNSSNKKIDILISHDIPIGVMKKEFWFLMNSNYENTGQDYIQYIWEKLGNPKIYCGKMHRNISRYNYRILGINEMIEI